MRSSGPCVSGLPFVVTRVLLRDEISFDHYTDVYGVELLIDDGTVADEPAETQISLDQGRERHECPGRIDRAAVEPAHVHVALGERPWPQLRGGQMMVVQVGERHGESIWIGTGQARAAEHQDDVVVRDIGRDTTPQQLHCRPLAVSGIDAGPAELENLAGM